MQESLSFPFSAAVLLEAESVRARIASCSAFPLVQGITLDPAISQDLDDALWVTQDSHADMNCGQHNKCGIFSSMETPELEQEAHREREMYVADKAICPLLPPVLSEVF